MDWKCLEENHHNPSEWGWIVRNGLNHPIFTDQPAAPADLLKLMRSNSKLSTRNPSSSKCSCKKNGLPVSLAVGTAEVMVVKTNLLKL